MTKLKSTYLTLLAVLLVPMAAHADPIVFENPYTDGVVTGGGAWCSGCGSNFRVWDTFDLGADTSVTQIDARLWLNGTTQLEYSIWTADRTTELFSQLFDVGDLLIDAFGGFQNNDVSAAISGLSLTAGSYALSIWDLGASFEETAWWAINASGGSGFQSQGGSGTGRDFAFRVYGNETSVPEPGTLVLLGIGLLGMGLARRKKV